MSKSNNEFWKEFANTTSKSLSKNMKASRDKFRLQYDSDSAKESIEPPKKRSKKDRKTQFDCIITNDENSDIISKSATGSRTQDKFMAKLDSHINYQFKKHNRNNINMSSQEESYLPVISQPHIRGNGKYVQPFVSQRPNELDMQSMNSASSWSNDLENSESKSQDNESLNSSYKKDLEMIKQEMVDQDLNEEAEIAKLKKEFQCTND